MDELLDTKEMPASENRLTHFASVQHREPEMASALSMITRSHATEAADIGFVGGVSRSESLVSAYWRAEREVSLFGGDEFGRS